MSKKKLALMTKLAIYEKEEAKNIALATKYFRGDYIGWNIIKTIFAITVVYVLGAAMWVIYNLELIMQNLGSLNFMAIIRYAIVLYIVLLAAYIAITYVVCSIKFHKASKSLEKYEKGLKQLAKIYVEEASGHDVEENMED